MPPTRCENCGLPASLRCVGCMDAPEYEPHDADGVVYCNAECQQKHWAFHKAQCATLKKRRRLLRVAMILRAALLTYRAALFDIPLAKIELKGGVLHLHRSRSPITLRPFPPYLTANVAHKEAALTHNQCTLAHALLGPLARKLLAGVASSLEITDLQIGKPLLRTRLVEIDPTVDFGTGAHTVVKARLVSKGTADGETWIIDPAGGQYGFREVLVPFKRYLTEKECTIVNQGTPYTAHETSDLAYYESLFPIVGATKIRHAQQKKGRLHFAAFIKDRVGDGQKFFASVKDLDGSADEFQLKFEDFLKELKAHMEMKK
ncbi:hypothetical protein DFH06DRAFT_1029854 [Mycena polygramma]|nr:hypothetical protein DFH06DRAFT_1029854 [Mycena polygramma]